MLKMNKCLRLGLFLYLSWILLSSPTFNTPIFEVKTNYLHWSSTLPAFSVCRPYPSHNMSGLEGFLENLVHPKEKYCLHCKNTTNYPLNNYREIVKTRTTPCRQLFVDCSWNRLKLDCCSVFKHLPTPGGTCYTINSEMTGSRHKLEVSHYSKQGELFFTTTRDVQVYIHDPKEITISESPTFTVRKKEKLDVIFGFRETLAEDSAKLLSYKRRGCILSTELSQYPLYSQTMCRLRCLAKEQASLCACVHHLIAINVNMPDCNLTGLRCLDQKLGRKLERELQRKCHCLPSCEEMDISIIWHNISRINTKMREVKFSIISPPSEKGFLKSRYQLLDAIVLVACLSRLFTSISIYDVYKMWYIRRQQTFQSINQYDYILI